MKILHIDLKLQGSDHAKLRAQFDRQLILSEKTIALSEIRELVENAKTYFYNPLPDPVKTGKQLYRWLDGDERWLSGAIAQSQMGIVLEIEAVERLAHLPWEVLHDGAGFLVMRSRPVVPVRWMRGEAELPEMQERSLRALFMATDPELPGEQKLDFEREEADILRSTQHLAMTLRVEESGSLNGLRQVWQRQGAEFDLLHLSGHANIGRDGEPYFVVEAETGELEQATAEEIAEVLRFRVPRLVFLSGCRTGEGAASLCERLMESGVPAVLGWGRSVGDRVATVAAAKLYEQLAAGYGLAESLAVTYAAVAREQRLSEKERSQWQLLRLFAKSGAVGALVPPLGETIVAPIAPMEDLFLDADGKTVRVASAAEFVGRRRNLQRSLRALRSAQLGVMLHGMGGIGKSTIAKRLLERLVGYTPIVIFRQLDEKGLISKLTQQCEADQGLEILNGRLGLAQRLSKFFKQGLNDPKQRFVFVLDDFEGGNKAEVSNLEERGDGQWVMKPEVVPVLQGLLEGIELSGLPHRVILTSRYDFGLPAKVNRKVHREPIAGLQGGELRKKCDLLEAFEAGAINQGLQQKAIRIADGNPRLLEWLNLVLLDEQTDQQVILGAMEREATRFRADILAEQLLAQQSKGVRKMLARGLVFELAVSEAVFCEVTGGSADEIDRAISIGLLEVFPNGDLRVPRILPLELTDGEALASRAARVVYRVWWQEAESSTEAQRVEIHRLAVIGKEKEIAVEIGDKLAIRWKNQSRFREAVQICKSTLEVTEDFRIRHRLAWAEEPLGETTAAIQDYQKALADCPDSEDSEVLREKSAIIHNLAGIYAQQGQVSEAVRLYEQSLELEEQIGDVQGKAATLHCMAIIYAQQGQVSEAITLYQQSLELTEQIGDVKVKAATLHNLAIIYAQQGQVSEAITLYQQSLELTEQIGDVKVKAATLHQMAGIYAQQGQVSEAITLYQRSLELEEQIGDVQGKAATLAMMGQLLADQQGEFDTAIAYLQESLAILQRIQSWEAQTVQDILSRIMRQKNLQSPEG
jgi:tetratricopeptide (TPR) repeat protein